MRSIAWILLAFCIASCGRKEHADKRIFKYNEHSGITSLDPIYARNLANIWAVSQIYEGLTRLDSDGKVVPALALSWSCDSLAQNWTFVLRKEVYWHPHPQLKPGATFCPEDAKASLERAAQHPFTQWLLSDLDSIWVPDNHRLSLAFSGPKPQLPALLSMPTLALLPKEILKNEQLRSKPSGTGPFHLVAWHEQEKMVLRRFEDYWMQEQGKQLPYLDGISISFVKDLQTAKLDFLLGRLHMLQGAEPALQENLRQEMEKGADFKEVNGIYLNIEYIGFRLGSKHPVCQKPLLRKALAAALNKEELIREVRAGLGEPANRGFCPPVLSSGGIPEEKVYPDSIAFWVQEAGFENPSQVPEFVLHTDPAYAAFTTAIVGQWRAAGFQVRSEIMDRSSLKAAVAQGQLDCFRASWIADYPDPLNVLSLFDADLKAPHGPNYTQFAHPEVQELLHKATRLAPGPDRQALVRQIEWLLRQEMPVIPVYYDVSQRFIGPNVTGMEPNPMNHLDLRKVRLEAP